MKQFVLFFVVLFFSCSLFSQSDSIVLNNEFILAEGLYMHYTDFRKNNPIPKEAIVSPNDKSLLDFIGKTLSENKQVTITTQGATSTIEVKSLWGYSQNNALYLNYEGKFYRVPVFGNISHFLGTVEVYNYMSNYGMYGGGYYGNGMMGPATPVKQREVRQFLFDFYTGEIMDYTLSNVEILISRDLKMYEEYMQLKKKKRRDMMMLYIRKYNAAHPVYFPVKK